MFGFGSAIFWYKIIFVTELIAVEGVFVPLLKEREKLGLRLFLSVVCLYSAALVFPVPEYSPFFICLLFFGLFLVNLAGMFVCFKEKPQALLFVGIFAYTVQHFSYMTASYIMSLFGVDVGSVYEGAISPSNTASLLVGVAVFLPAFCLSFFYIKSITKGLREISVNGLPLVVISIIALSVNVILNSVVISAEPPQEPLLTVYFVYDLVSCVMIIGLLTTSLLNKTLRREMDVMAFKMEKSKESYELKKDKIDKINIMCHDLKHRITELENGGYASEKLKKLEDVIRRYDSIYNTGNETLNVVLAGFGEKCEKRGVTFICVADGSALEFMKEDHIYSLFDNVLSNAYEATEKIETKENRYIKLQLERREMLVTLHVENTFLNAEEMVFDGDLPVTTKKDGDWHGLGMKSIKMIVDYYDGGFNFSVNGNIFCVDAFFPTSEKSD